MPIARRFAARATAALVAGVLVSMLVPAGGADAKLASPKVMPCKRGKVQGFPCKGIDLVANVPAEVMGGALVADVWGWVDPETGSEYAVLGSNEGVQFFDMSDPTSPTYLGFLAGKVEPQLIWQEIEILNDHLYAVCDLSPCNLQIFDLTRLRDGVPPGGVWVPDSIFPVAGGSAHSIDSNPETNHVFINGSLALNGMPVILDVSTPLAPLPVGVIADDGYTHDSLCRTYEGPDAAYQGHEICFNFNEDSITIYDVTASPAAPEQLARLTYDTSGYVHSGAMTTDHATLISTDEGDESESQGPTSLYVWDIRELSAPTLINRWITNTGSIDHNIYSEAKALYHANYVDGFRIIDLSQAAKGKLREVAYFDTMPLVSTPTFDGAWAVYPYLPSGNVIVGDMTGQGFFIVRPQAAVLKKLGVKRP